MPLSRSALNGSSGKKSPKLDDPCPSAKQRRFRKITMPVADKAIDYTVRAGERSLRALAYEEASRTYE